MSEFMAQNMAAPVAPTPPTVEPQQPSVVEELSNAIGHTEPPSRPINVIPTTSIPINQVTQIATFIVGTPPPSSSFRSSSSSTSLNHQQFYSPIKHNSSSSSHLSDNQTFVLQQQQQPPQKAPISSPSLSFSYKKAMMLQQQQHNTSSSAESLISDMVKEAIQSNPMTQSVIGALEGPSKPAQASSRKRNTSLSLPSPDLHTKRMLNRKESFDEVTNASHSKAGTILREKNSYLSTHKESETNKNNLISFNDDDVDTDDDDDDDDKENNNDVDDDDDDIAESLIKSIDRNRHGYLKIVAFFDFVNYSANYIVVLNESQLYSQSLINKVFRNPTYLYIEDSTNYLDFFTP